MISLEQLKNIIEGCGNLATIKLFPNYKKELQIIRKIRLEICNTCNLFKNDSCNSELEEVALIDFKYHHEDRLKGKTYKGCNCNMQCKTLVLNETCPLGKWLSITI